MLKEMIDTIINIYTYTKKLPPNQEAHTIRTEITDESIKTVRIAKHNRSEIKTITDTIAYKVALASGAKRRAKR